MTKQTPEAKVKRAIKEALNAYGAYHCMPPANGYGRSGIPDILACYRGQFIAIEAKAGRNRTTALQDLELDKIRTTGGISLVINELNLDTLLTVLDDLQQRGRP
jgi:Holliday junction resolvase